MNKKGSASLLIMTFVAILVGVVAYMYLPTLLAQPNRSNKTPATEITSSEQAAPPETTADPWQIPQLPSQVTWESTELFADDQYDSRDIYIDTTSETPENYKDIEYIQVRTPGYLYSTSVKDSTSNFDSEGYTVKFTFEKELVKSGWQNPIELGKYRITGVAADGVHSSTYGLVKIVDGYIRTVVVSYNKRGKGFANDTGPELLCPCFTDVSVFIGEPVKLQDYF